MARDATRMLGAGFTLILVWALVVGLFTLLGKLVGSAIVGAGIGAAIGFVVGFWVVHRVYFRPLREQMERRDYSHLTPQLHDDD